MSLLNSLRTRLAFRSAPEADDSRRDFFRNAAGAGAAVLGAGLLLPEDAWAGVEERAERFGITPGTVVDASGRPVPNSNVFGEPFVAAVGLFAGNFAPRGWALCEGQLLPVSQYGALFSILGTIYGGDGETAFALPDLRGRTPIQQGNGPGLSPYRLGDKGGQEWVTLTSVPVPTAEAGAATHNSIDGQAHENRPPFLAMNYIIALYGIFPSRN